MATQDQWAVTWSALGAPPPERVYDALVARYAEPHRHYHTQRHLAECFAQLADVRAGVERLGEVELALWFHDAIYDTKRRDNERRSAEWAREAAVSAGLSSTVGERIAALVMATRHAAVPVGPDAHAVVDVDLSILGAPRERFDEYERDVRLEYGWVPGLLFRRERRKILRGFLERPRIFQTNAMHAAREERARANLERALRRLEGGRRVEP